MEPYINNDVKNIWFGKHYILDLYGIKPSKPTIKMVEHSLQKAAIDSGATILNSFIHKFQNDGISGVVVLKESHISIHTWPESSFAAIDVYMCGSCDPEIAIHYLIKVFHPDKYDYIDVKRGLTPNISVDNNNKLV